MAQTHAAASQAAAEAVSQSWSRIVADVLLQHRVHMIGYVPDEVSGHLLTRLEANPACAVVCCTREEEAVATVAGAYLGGKRGAVILQTSGVGNSMNALGSFVVPYQIPMLLIVSERGGLGEFNPAQVPLGHAVPRVLDALGIQTFAMTSESEIVPILGGAAELAFSTMMPVAVVLSMLLTGGKTLK
jgi:sulfopyruvate decarboxylase alpha subunit